jgi:hypothetical protein
MANKEYFVTRLSFRDGGQLIRDVTVYEYDGMRLDNGASLDRQWMVNKVTADYQISIMTPNSDERGKWNRHDPFTYEGGYFKWEFKLPTNDTKRKTFISYYHKDDQDSRTTFENIFGDLIVSKSVEDGDIDSDNSDEYIKQLIQKDYLADTTVLVVLVGPKTKCRKHVDWEIAGAISTRVGGNSGLIGILLPSHPDYGEEKKYNADNLPKRLAANLESGYAKLYDWTEDRVKMQNFIENAIKGKSDTDKIRNKSIPQMDKDTCE